MATKPKAIITTHDDLIVSPITISKNILMNDGQNVQEILNSTDNTMISPTIVTYSSMSKVGQGDSVDYSENVKDGAYSSCVLKGVTKFIDNDTQEILDTFVEGRNLSLIDVKSPVLSNSNMLDSSNIEYKSNTVSIPTYYDKTTLSHKPIVLRSLPNGVYDILNVGTGEHTIKIGERAYQIGDLELLDVYTNGVVTRYKLTTPTVHKVDVSGFPFAYKGGHVIVSSGSVEQSLTPKVEYSLPINRNGQIQVNQKMVEKQQKQLDYLEKMIVTNVVVSSYEQTLTSLNYELSRV